MESKVERKHLPGMSVLVHRQGQTAFFETVGHMDVEAAKPVAEDTIFRIYSMTKPITSIAVMMLYEEGLFQLDDPVARFLPEFTDMQVYAGETANGPKLEPAKTLITIRQLLTHTAGLTYDFMMSSPVDAMYRANKIKFSTGKSGSLESMVKRLAEMPLLCHPGTEWNYSVATDVLGRLVEVISGQSLDRFFAERILEPLGMVDTAFQVPEDKLDRFAAMYTPTPGTAVPLPASGPDPARIHPAPKGGLQLMDPADGIFARSVQILSGGGGLTSTMVDYLRFCRMLRNKGELDGVRIIGRKTLEFMTRNHLPGSLADMGQPRFGAESDGAGLGFGLGFAIVLDPARAQTIGSVGEYAWTGVASTQFWIDPVEDMIVLQMSQLVPSSTFPLRRELRALTYQALIE
ncbi:serine hydrolase [Alkalilimnicola ehrlichii]|uniref:Serine hydrolase n=2 Tax=Alkalilimnicola ehrlichii TaxID=351052 RepID=A0A3E0WKL7_9GAMM|nr:serine hydrolase [Alkalilimnicola ehrlichii]RFA32949.1 serine hydrolase [Alkalilimnicola ehrlichii]